MRDILFRGKRLDKGKWHYGSYLFLHVPDRNWAGTPRGPAKDVHYIVDQEDINYAVDPDTVGQYTGLDDKKGRKIFEGDLVKLDGWEPSVMQIAFIEGAFCLADGTGEYAGDIHYIHHAGVNQSEVVGNIYDDLDNPDLLWFSQREAGKS